MNTRNFNEAMAFMNHYPQTPAGWPNRAVRRAVKRGRMDKVPSEWRQLMAVQPELKKAIAAL